MYVIGWFGQALRAIIDTLVIIGEEVGIPVFPVILGVFLIGILLWALNIGRGGDDR